MLTTARCKVSDGPLAVWDVLSTLVTGAAAPRDATNALAWDPVRAVHSLGVACVARAVA